MPALAPERMLRQKRQQRLRKLERRRELRDNILHQVQELEEHRAELLILLHLTTDELSKRRYCWRTAGTRAARVFGGLMAASHAARPELKGPLKGSLRGGRRGHVLLYTSYINMYVYFQSAADTKLNPSFL